MITDLPVQNTPAIVKFLQQNKLNADYMHYYCNWEKYDVYIYFNPANYGKAVGLFPYILQYKNNIKLVTPSSDKYDKIHDYCNNVNRQLMQHSHIQD